MIETDVHHIVCIVAEYHKNWLCTECPNLTHNHCKQYIGWQLTYGVCFMSLDGITELKTQMIFFLQPSLSSSSKTGTLQIRSVTASQLATDSPAKMNGHYPDSGSMYIMFNTAIKFYNVGSVLNMRSRHLYSTNAWEICLCSYSCFLFFKEIKWNINKTP